MDKDSDSFLGGVIMQDEMMGALKVIRELHVSSSGPFRILLAERMGKRFILKTLKEIYAGDPQFLLMLRKEFEIGFSLSHPGIVRYLDFQMVDEYGQCIVEEYIEGKSLGKVIKDGALSPAQISGILDRLLNAVEYLHERQVVHNDLKPSNIIISDFDKLPKIMDFGYADAPGYVSLKFLGGTELYIAPERLENDYKTDSRSDIWSVGEIIRQIASSQKGKYKHKLERIACECNLPVGQRIQSVALLHERLRKSDNTTFKWIIRGVSIILIVVIGIWGLKFLFHKNIEEEGGNIRENVEERIVSLEEGEENAIKEDKKTIPVVLVNGNDNKPNEIAETGSNGLVLNEDTSSLKALGFAQTHIKNSIDNLKAKGLYKRPETVGELWNARYLYDSILKDIESYIDAMPVNSEEKRKDIKTSTILKAREMLDHEVVFQLEDIGGSKE